MKVFVCFSLLVALTLAEPPVYRQQPQNERNKYYFARQTDVDSPAEAPAAPYQPSGWKPDGPAFELPEKQQKQLQASPQQQYGAPQTAPQQQYGAPSAPQRQYGAPAAPQKQYGAPQAATPQQQQQRFRGFPTSQRQYAAPSAPQQSYGAPAAPQQSYGAPAAPQQSYGPPEDVTTTQEPTSTDFEESTTVPSGTESEAEPVNSVNELDIEGDVDEQQRQSGQYYVALPDGRLQRVQYMSSQDIEAMKYFARIQAENVEPLRGPIYAYQPLQKLQFAPTSLRIAVPDPYAPAGPVVAIREPVVASKTAKAAPEKLQQGQQQQQQQQQPLAAEVSYDSPINSYSPYSANYQTPTEQRYFVTF